MKNNTQGFITNKLLSLLLAAAMMLTLGMTAAALNDDTDIVLEDFDDVDVIELEDVPAADPAGETHAEPEEAADSDIVIELEEVNEPEITVDSVGLDYDEYYYACLADVADELNSLTEEQLAQIKEIWINNRFIIGTADEILGTYSFDFLSREASYILYMANSRYCNIYINETYTGDADNLERLNYLNTALVNSLKNQDLDSISPDGAIGDLLVELYETIISMELQEEEEVGRPVMMELYNNYGLERGEADFEEFIGIVADMK